MPKLNYICITHFGYILPIAHHLHNEGNKVITCLVTSKEVNVDSGLSGDDSPEFEKRRKSLMDGILPKMPLDKLLEMAAKIENKDEWFILFDYNHLWKIADKFQKLGFKKGLFPIEDDFTFEEDRKASKELIKKEFPSIKVGNVFDFKKVDDGIDFLNENEGIYALKSEGDFVKTTVPLTNDGEFAKQELIYGLKKNQKEYEKGGFILEEKIKNAKEIVPQVVFWNGKLIYSNVSMETRLLGAGEVGYQTGGNQVTLIMIDPDSKIVKWTCPKFITDRAKKRKGLFLFDCSLLFDEKGTPYFGEFCGNRWGYGDIFTELTMADGPSAYFEAISEGKNPMKFKYGTYLTVYNMKSDSEFAGLYESNKPIQTKPCLDPYLYLYQIKKDDEFDGDQIIGVGYDEPLLGWITGRGNSFEESVEFLYKKFEGNISYNGLYYRPKEDFLTKSYQSSIPNRLEFIEKYGLINVVKKLGESFEQKDNKFKVENERFEQYKEQKRNTYDVSIYLTDIIGKQILEYYLANPNKSIIIENDRGNLLFLRYGKKN